jgi:ELWxxDGT repeat protein
MTVYQKRLAIFLVVVVGALSMLAGPLFANRVSEAALVKDIFPDTGSGNPRALVNVNGTLFFLANDGFGYPKLWKSDGTATGTVVVKDLNPSQLVPGQQPPVPAGGITPEPRYLTAVGNTLFFVAYTTPNSSFRYTLWKSDGTETGTQPVKSTPIIDPQNLVNVNGTLFFTSMDDAVQARLWKSDGTDAGTGRVMTTNPDAALQPSALTNVQGTLFFQSSQQLWKSDGTDAGTVVVKALPGSIPITNPASTAALNGVFYFAHTDTTSGTELWKSDGTQAGTTLVKDIFPGTGITGANSASPHDFITVGGLLYFGAYDGANGEQGLWRSDGTEAGTTRIKSFINQSDVIPTNLTTSNGLILFQGSDPTHGNELWKSDGTEAGTVLVKDIVADSVSSYPANLTSVNGVLFFIVKQVDSSSALYKSDGTEAGTVLVKVISPSLFVTPNYLTAVNSTLFFQSRDTATGQELWKVTVSTELYLPQIQR